MSGPTAAIVLGVLLGAVVAGIIVYVIWRKRLSNFYRNCLTKFRIGQTQPDYVNCYGVSDNTNTCINPGDGAKSLAGVYTLATLTADNAPSFHRNDSRRIKHDDKVDLIAAADDISNKTDPIYTEPNAATSNFQDDDLDGAWVSPMYEEPGLDVPGTGEIVVRTVTPTYSRQKYIGQTASAVYVELEPNVDDDDTLGGKTEANKKAAALKWKNSSLKANTADRPRTKPKPMYSSLGYRTKINNGNEYNAPQVEGKLDVENDEDDLL